MTRRQKNILNMWHALQNLLKEFAQNVALHASIGQQVDRFYQLHAELEQYGRAQTNGSVGVTQDKQALREQGEKEGFVVAANLRSWAKGQENSELTQNMSFSKRDLRRMSDVQLLQVLALVQEHAEANAAGIAPFGTTTQKLKEFVDTVQRYHANVGSPRRAINKKTVATLRIAELVSEGQELLTEIDGLMYNYEDEQPDFLKQYFKARVIIDRGGGNGKGEDEGVVPVV